MTTIKKIETLLGITLEEKRYGNDYDANQKNTYSGSEEHVDRLHLDDVNIESLIDLAALTGELSALTLVNTTIPNFSDLHAFNPYYLTLDGVTIKNTDCKTKGALPWHLKLYNMHFDARALDCFEQSSKRGFRQVNVRNCHIENIQFISAMQQVSYLILDKITFSYTPLEVERRSGIYRMSVYHSKLEHVSFLPFKKDLSHIQFGSCKIESLAGLEDFPKLEGITISTDTQVKDKRILPNKHGRKIHGGIFHVKKPFDLENLLPLKNYITSFGIDDFKSNKLPHLNQFKRIKELHLSGGKVNLEVFLPLASQIKTLVIDRAIFYNHTCLSQFKKLTSFQLKNFSKGKKALQSFERILPLKKQLKELEIYDSKKIKDIHFLKAFKSLESIKLNDLSFNDAQHLLEIKQLKKLKLCVVYKKNKVLNLGQLSQLEYLIIDTKTRFTGLEQLHQLKSLELGSDFTEAKLNLSKLPRLKRLERLKITNYNQKINGFKQFPRLKYLYIKGCPDLKLKTLMQLEVLDLDNSSIKDLSKIDTQPKLKKLNLSSQVSLQHLKGIDRFPNLKILDLMESTVEDISALEATKNLEILDLYYTSVKDVKVINTLPNMKEINLATRSGRDLENQLDRPEIAVYVGLPTKYLSIWKEDEFGI